MVEVIHQWPMLKYPEMAILKLVGVTSMLFLTGLLPWVDNYAHLFGFIFGFFLSYALLPFVTFSGNGPLPNGNGAHESGGGGSVTRLSDFVTRSLRICTESGGKTH